jgi:hypothetical protein
VLAVNTQCAGVRRQCGLAISYRLTQLGSANGRDRMLGTPLGRFSMSFARDNPRAGHAMSMERTGGVGLDVTGLHAWERSTQELPADDL